MVPVIVQGSDLFTGFDITLISNHTTLKPADALISGSLLAGGTIILKCIGGVLKAGSVCSQTDTVDTIHFAYAGPFGFIPLSPVNGLLFTAVFNVTGNSNVTIGYQTGCARSSVTNTNICVLLGTGSSVPASETVQGAVYSQQPAPTFTITTATSFLEIIKGTSQTATITLQSLNGFSGTISLSPTITPGQKHNPVASMSPVSVTLSSGGFATSTLTVSAPNDTTQGTYQITVTGTAGSLTAAVNLELQIVS
jgi:hypothetical protein